MVIEGTEGWYLELLAGVVGQNTQFFLSDFPDRIGERRDGTWKMSAGDTSKIEPESLLQVIR